MTADEVIAHLNLQPHPLEGGFFRETYRSGTPFSGGSLSTAIFYLLTPATRSHLHKLPSDEVYHFYLGDAVEMLQLSPGGPGRIVMLGPNIKENQRVQHVAPRGIWQGSRLAAGGRWALLGTTMAPGFVWSEFEPGDRKALSAQWPELAAMIADLTPN